MSIVYILITTSLFKICILFEKVLDHAGGCPLQTYFDDGYAFISTVVSYLTSRLQ